MQSRKSPRQRGHRPATTRRKQAATGRSCVSRPRECLCSMFGLRTDEKRQAIGAFMFASSHRGWSWRHVRMRQSGRPPTHNRALQCTGAKDGAHVSSLQDQLVPQTVTETISERVWPSYVSCARILVFRPIRLTSVLSVLSVSAVRLAWMQYSLAPLRPAQSAGWLCVGTSIEHSSSRTLQ